VNPAFVPVGRGVHVLRHPVLDVNVTLVEGAGSALLVDTLSTADQAAALLDAVRQITRDPLVVVLTHHHFDHCYGTATLRPAAVWAHPAAAAALADPAVRAGVLAEYSGYPGLAGVADVTVAAPDHTVTWGADLDLGDRQVQLRHHGRGHTAGDLVIRVPDAGVTVLGDLLEEGAPPSFGDAYPLEWPAALAAALAGLDEAETLVPGHGAVVDVAFARVQHDQLSALDWLIRDGHADGGPVAAVAARAPFPADVAEVAVRRGYAELSGRAQTET
jgi:glyoxylase-like metal-dependent hydrolase (beta-lactamase superfamily II)